jgi:hypothetical protein
MHVGPIADVKRRSPILLEREGFSPMQGRIPLKFRPGLERLESKQLLDASPSSAHALNQAGTGALAAQTVEPQSSPATPLVLSRITNPTPTNAQLIPPFQQVRVQTVTPVIGGIYNILFVSVRNSTTQTFDASNNFQVKLSGGKLAVPILTGAEQWKPGQVIVFYILSKKYYPLSPQVSAGFAFNFLGRENVAIPGPSGIFQRIKYDPATINNIINYIVPFGPGAKGHLLGLPDTAIWEFTAGKAKLPPHHGK